MRASDRHAFIEESLRIDQSHPEGLHYARAEMLSDSSLILSVTPQAE